MLIKVKYQNWSGNFAYAPPVEDAVINTEEIVNATPTESRGSGPWTKVKFRDGSTMTIQGNPDQLLLLPSYEA